jgi:hypothetical protein
MSGFFASRRAGVVLAVLAGLVHAPIALAAPEYTITENRGRKPGTVTYFRVTK